MFHERGAEAHQLQEIIQAEEGAPGGLADKGIGRGQAGPGQGQGVQVVVFREEHDAPLAPILANAEHLKAPPVPGMKGERYLEELRLSAITRCC